MSLTVFLPNAHEGHVRFTRLWSELKNLLLAEHQLVVTVKPKTRTVEQNAKFHAICADVAKSGAKWGGKTRTAAQWKVLFVSGHAMATKEGADILPGLESEFVNLRESTALMSVRRSSSLIDYTLAWCAQNDVELTSAEKA